MSQANKALGTFNFLYPSHPQPPRKEQKLGEHPQIQH